jgi:hypothetical protein
VKVTFDWSQRNPETNQYEPVAMHGEVVTWLVVPEEESTGPYGEGPRITNYYPSAIVAMDDNRLVTLRVDQLTRWLP